MAARKKPAPPKRKAKAKRGYLPAVVIPMPRKVGRPPAYKPEYAEIAFRLTTVTGATDQEVADFFAIGLTTLNRWREAHAEFRDALKIGKDAPDDRVEKSLYRQALGYMVPAEKIIVIDGVVHRVETREYVQPNPAAAIFWLKNRRRLEWRDRQALEIEGNDGPAQIDLSNQLNMARAIVYILEKAAANQSKVIEGEQAEDS